MNPTQLPELVDATRIASLFNVTVQTVHFWRRCELLPAVKIGRTVRFDLAGCLAVLRTGRPDAGEAVQS